MQALAGCSPGAGRHRGVAQVDLSVAPSSPVRPAPPTSLLHRGPPEGAAGSLHGTCLSCCSRGSQHKKYMRVFRHRQNCRQQTHRRFLSGMGLHQTRVHLFTCLAQVCNSIFLGNDQRCSDKFWSHISQSQPALSVSQLSCLIEAEPRQNHISRSCTCSFATFFFCEILMWPVHNEILYLVSCVSNRFMLRM